MIYVISSVHPLSDSRIYHRQVKSLAKYYPVRVFAQQVEGWRSEGIDHVALPRGKGLRIRLKNFFILFRASLSREARVIHFHDPELMLVGLAAKVFGKKVVYDVHENYSKTIRYKQAIPKPLRGLVSLLYKWLEKFCCRCFDLILVVTDELQEQLPGNVHTLKNYPLITFTPPDKELSQGPLKLVYVGLITPARGILSMIEAVKKVKQPVEFDIIGHFNSAEFRRTVEAELAGVENIRYVPSFPYSEFFARLVGYDVGMMCLLPNPNHVTSLPNKLFEYMSMGMAILASDFPLWQKIIGGVGCGVLVDPEDIDTIKGAIERFAADREGVVEMGRRGQRAYRAQFNWQSQEEKLILLYRKMLGEENA